MLSPGGKSALGKSYYFKQEAAPAHNNRKTLQKVCDELMTYDPGREEKRREREGEIWALEGWGPKSISCLGTDQSRGSPTRGGSAGVGAHGEAYGTKDGGSTGFVVCGGFELPRRLFGVMPFLWKVSSSFGPWESLNLRNERLTFGMNIDVPCNRKWSMVRKFEASSAKVSL
ncbi:hypothetical protein NL676_012948 [Syzygium grande]|nr:hypothetical protein NL676_012948 [Syzygium grande]